MAQAGVKYTVAAKGWRYGEDRAGVRVQPYEIAFGTMMIPKADRTENLLVPVCLSLLPT
jgi:hypothetical protein